MSLKALAKKNKSSLSLLSLAALLPFIGDSAAVSMLIAYQDIIADFSFMQWFLFYLLIAVLAAFALSHTTFIAIASGFFLGWRSVPFVFFSYGVALLIGYFLGKRVDKGKLMESLMEIPKAKIIAQDLKSNELKIIVLARLSPILPFAMMSLFLSMLKADFKNYLLGGFAGMLPRTMLFIYSGVIARDLTEALKKGMATDFSAILVGVLLIFSVLGLIYYVVKATRKAKEPSKD